MIIVPNNDIVDMQIIQRVIQEQESECLGVNTNI